MKLFSARFPILKEITRRRLSALFFVFLFLNLFGSKTEAQNFRCTYRYSFKNTPKGAYGYFDNMKMDFFNSQAIYYCESAFLRDSLKAIAYDANGRLVNNEAYAEMTRIPVGVRDFVLTDFALGNVRVYHQVATIFILGESRKILPEWGLHEESRDIAGYTARKASANYLGRNWEIWYVPELPASAGPWLLWGAPGLIVYAQDSEKLFCFEMTYIEDLLDGSRISFLKWYHEDRARTKKNQFVFPLSRAEAFHYKMRTDIDFYNQTLGRPGNRAYSVDSNGEKRELVFPPYIPLIPLEYGKNR